MFLIFLWSDAGFFLVDWVRDFVWVGYRFLLGNHGLFLDDRLFNRLFAVYWVYGSGVFLCLRRLLFQWRLFSLLVVPVNLFLLLGVLDIHLGLWLDLRDNLLLLKLLFFSFLLGL